MTRQLTAEAPDMRELICREHDELREVLVRVQGTLSARRETPDFVCDLMASLRAEVEAHFRDEETIGLFADVLERAPRLQLRVQGLRREHQFMADSLRRLTRLAQQTTGTGSWWQELETDFRDFARDLMQHEREEIGLMQDAFDDLGTSD